MTTLWAPATALDVSRCGSPLVSNCASPSELGVGVAVDLGEAYATPLAGKSVHIVDSGFCDTGAPGAPVSLGDHTGGRGIPLVPPGASPSEFGISTPIFSRKAISSPLFRDLHHVFDCLVPTDTEWTPLTRKYLHRCGHPRVSLGTPKLQFGFLPQIC